MSKKRKGRTRPYFAAMCYQQRLVVAVLLCTAFASCKKDAEERAPVVTIIAPGDGYDLSVPDTLNIVADVSGEQDVENVSFTISNADGIPIVAPIRVVPATNPARLEVDIPLISDLLASGEYTLTVQANSGQAQGKDRAIIDIIGTPLRLRRLLVIGQPAPDVVNVQVIDSTGAVSLANSLVMDLGGAAVSSAGRTFALMGVEDGPMLALAPDGIQVPWQKPNLGGSGVAWFTSLDLCADGRYHVGTTDGVLRGYNAMTGATERVSDLPVGYRARRTCIVGEKSVVVVVDQTGTNWRLGIYQTSSGSLVGQHQLEIAVVALFERGAQHVLLFGNQDGHGVVRDHDIENDGGWEPYQWIAPIIAVERVDANTLLVALADGSLERFTYSNAGSVTIRNIADIRDLSLDPVSGLMWMAAGTSVLAMDPQSGQTAANYSMGSPVHHVLPLLNR